MNWKDEVQTIGPDELIEVPDMSIFNQNRDRFTEAGFTVEMMDALFPYLEQQMMSILAVFRLASSVCPDGGGRIVEIGSGKGGSMISMHMAKPTATFINIDPFEPYDETSAYGTVKDYKGFKYENFRANMDKFGVGVETIRERSDIAHTKLEIGSVDMLFVDGNHTYENCKADIQNYRSKVTEGGILCGHDFHPRFPGVIKAVIEEFGPEGYDVMPGSSVWMAMD